MKNIILILSVFTFTGNSFCQNNVGHFKFSVQTISDSLINDYKLIVINEKSNDTLEFESVNINQPLKLADGSYSMLCTSGAISAQVVGVVIRSNHMTFYDFKLENKLTIKHKKRKNKYR